MWPLLSHRTFVSGFPFVGSYQCWKIIIAALCFRLCWIYGGVEKFGNLWNGAWTRLCDGVQQATSPLREPPSRLRVLFSRRLENDKNLTNTIPGDAGQQLWPRKSVVKRYRSKSGMVVQNNSQATVYSIARKALRKSFKIVYDTRSAHFEAVVATSTEATPNMLYLID